MNLSILHVKHSAGLDPETLMQQEEPITRINTLIKQLDFQWPCLSVGTLWSCLLPLKLWVSIPLMVYSTQHYIIKFVSNLRQVGGFRRILRLPPLHRRNIIESDVKHHNTNLNLVLAINYVGMKHSVHNLMV